METSTAPTEIATFSAGCFWDSEAAFRTVEGVIATRVGFMGGKAPNPTYEEVCSGTTDHVEVVQVVFDPSKVSYNDLLDIFWSMIDTVSQENVSIRGRNQYRPVIFFHSEAQGTAAQISIEKRRRTGDSMVVRWVCVFPASGFYEAEEHHQQFYEKCGRGYTAMHHYYE